MSASQGRCGAAEGSRDVLQLPVCSTHDSRDEERAVMGRSTEDAMLLVLLLLVTEEAAAVSVQSVFTEVQYN